MNLVTMVTVPREGNEPCYHGVTLVTVPREGNEPCYHGNST